jgi:hypothetical protein
LRRNARGGHQEERGNKQNPRITRPWPPRRRIRTPGAVAGSRHRLDIGLQQGANPRAGKINEPVLRGREGRLSACRTGRRAAAGEACSMACSSVWIGEAAALVAAMGASQRHEPRIVALAAEVRRASHTSAPSTARL